MAKLFESFGIVADVYIGHSIGEFCAATLAGVFTLDDALKMVAKRGELMSKLNPGKMLSVVSKLENIQEFLGVDIQLAAINSKLACVVAGSNEAVDNLKIKLAGKEIGFKELKTSHAFHSAMMDSILDEYERFLEDISFKTPKTKILSTVTTNYESEKFTKSAYWAMHMRETVKFYPAIKKMIKADSFHFIEMGPGNILSSLGKKTAMELKNKSTQFIPTLNIRKMNEYDSVNNAISELWQIDHIIEQYANGKFKKVVLPPYPFEKKRIWITPEIKQLKNENIGKTIMSTNNELLKTELIEIFEDASGIDIAEFSHDTSFLEMGMDSLFLTQIALNLKRKLKIEISFRQLMEDYRNLDLLSSFLSDKVTLAVPAQVEQVIAPAPAPTPTPVAVVATPASVQAPIPAAPVTIQAPVQTPVYQSAPTSGNIQDLINKQLEIMGQQMQLLAGQPVASTQTTSQPVAQPVPQARAPIATAPVAPAKRESTAKEVEVMAPKFKRGTEVDNVKKAFGAAPRINTKKSNSTSNSHNEFLNEMIREYLEKTKGSKKFTQDSRKLHADPRVVSGFKPESKEFVYPIVVEKSLAQSLWDVDGNKYTDMTCGFGSNFFGNGNPIIKKLILEQIDNGIEIGPQHPLAAEVSEMFCELTNTERAAFCSTGSEAVLGAMRLARTVTGRDLIIVFDGAYHGVMDEVIVRGTKKGRAIPASPGITNGAVSNMLVLEYGTEESLAKVRELASTAAAIMVEPVQSRRAEFHPKEFLQELRNITTENESCLIFDEVITGFRIHPGGAQAYFDVKADIASYGKIIGGGLPIGVIAGKAEFRDALDGGQWQYGDDSLPTVGVTYFAGTFCRHPLALAAAKGALTILAEGGEKMLNDLSQRAQAFVDEINDFSAQVESPFRIVNFGSLMKPKWKEDAPYSDLFFVKLRLEGVHAIDGFPWFVNLAHTDDELKFVVAAVKRSIRALQAMDIMPGKKVTFLAENTFDESAPPRVGAKIGRNEKGNPAWYIQDENNKDKYIEIEQ
jgi:glutamate-1-semialdehyde aminotransferase/acyl carrier protein